MAQLLNANGRFFQLFLQKRCGEKPNDEIIFLKFKGLDMFFNIVKRDMTRTKKVKQTFDI